MYSGKNKLILLIGAFICVLIMFSVYTKFYEKMLNDEMTTVVNVEYTINKNGEIEEHIKDVKEVEKENKEDAYPLKYKEK